MKAVAFSLGNAPAAKSSAKRVHEEDNVVKQERITEFTVEASAAPAKKERKVIACKPNRVPSNMQEEPDVIGKLEDKFQASTQAQTVGSGVYGLMSRDKGGADEHAREVTDLERLKKETDNLPDEPDGRAYDDMPVEDFGLALLRGMGMTKEHVVQTVEYVARPSRMGLGAKPGEIGAQVLSLHNFLICPFHEHSSLVAACEIRSQHCAEVLVASEVRFGSSVP